MTRVQIWQNKALLINGKLAVGDACCCGCQDCGCCGALSLWATVLFDVSANDCYGVQTGLSGGTTAPWSLSDLPLGTPGGLTVDCEEVSGDPSKIRLIIDYTLVQSDTCCLDNWHLEAEVDCYPFDYTFVIPTDDYSCGSGNKCCGDLEIRMYTDTCASKPYATCGCMFCEYCMPDPLSAEIQMNDQTCDPPVATPFITLNCTSDCVWESDPFYLGDDLDCYFKLKFYGLYTYNKWCDWRLDLLEGDDTPIYTGLTPVSGVPEGLTIIFEDIELPADCCVRNIDVIITEFGGPP